MEETFISITALAMLAGVIIGVFILISLVAIIPYQALIKREKPFSWYLKIIFLPICCFAFSGLMFLLRSFAPNFFGKPGGITITDELTHTIDGKVVHSDKEERKFAIERSVAE